MGIGALAGGLLQVVAQWPALRAIGYAASPRLDLSDPAVPQSIIEQTRGQTIDIVINNAGFGLRGAFAESDWAAESRMIQAAIGPVIVVRGAAWHGLGGFDEKAFMYAEDLDLCRRAEKLGWRVRFVADAEFVHVGRLDLQSADVRDRGDDGAGKHRVADVDRDASHSPPDGSGKNLGSRLASNASSSQTHDRR